MKVRESVTLGMRFAILSRDNYTCQYCGAKAPDAVLHVDHVKPVARGGLTEEANLVAACVRCNLGKSDREQMDFRDERPFSKRERRLANYEEWYSKQNHQLTWAHDIYCGSSQLKAFLLAAVHWADPYGSVSFFVEDIAHAAHLTADEGFAALHGLEVAGHVIPYEGHLRPLAGATEANFSLNFREREAHEHIRPVVLSDFRFADGFAPAERIYA